MAAIGFIRGGDRVLSKTLMPTLSPKPMNTESLGRDPDVSIFLRSQVSPVSRQGWEPGELMGGRERKPEDAKSCTWVFPALMPPNFH